MLLQLRQSLANKGQQAFSAFGHPDNFNEDKGYDSGDPDSEHPDIDMPESMYMDEDVLHFDKVCRTTFWVIKVKTVALDFAHCLFIDIYTAW